MRSRVLLATCAMVATVLAGCATGGGPVDMAAPKWSSGYAWTHAFETSWDATWQEDGERGNESGSVRGRVVQEVLNTSLTADGEPLYVVGTQEAEGPPKVQVVRQRDLSRLPFGWSQTSQCSNGDCSETFSLRNVHTDAPTFLDFPLQKGKRWGGAADEGAPAMAPQVVYEATVEGAARVDTPLGTITAARVVIHAVPDDASKFEQTIRSEAEAAGYQIDALRLDFSEHQVVYYSDEYQAIVLHHRESKESFYARGTDPEGQSFEYRSDEKERHRAVVEGARLVPRPERTMADVGKFMAGQLSLRDPTGQVVADVGYTLGIDPLQLTVNAGAGEEAQFTAAVDGELPDGTQLRWMAVSQQGKVVEEGTGDTFTFTPATAGRYSVEVESVAEEQVVAAAGAALVADWHRVDTLDCGAASVVGCAPQAVPVHPGAQSLYVRATPQGPVPDVGDVLRVIDSAGTVIQGERRNDDFVVDMSTAGHLVDADPWTVEFDQGIAVASPVELEVQVLYGPAGAEAPASQVARAPSFVTPWG